MDKRPNLDKNISIKDFQEFYWLKEELMTFCRKEKLITTGGKIELAERIEVYLKTGKQQIKTQIPSKKTSKFDWKNESLTLETQITDNYKNTENVRMFFVKQLGQDFKFNVKFMNWMKSNCGKTLKQAADEWIKIKQAKQANKEPKDIAPQFEYNRYLRDFLADNPNANRDLGIKLWKVKKSTRGDNVYKKEDMELMKDSIFEQ